MTERLNIISIFCNVSINCADHSEEKETNLIVIRKHIKYLFNVAFTQIGLTNRIILAADNSAAISYTGPPEDAMLVTTDILNRLSVSNKHCSTTLTAYFGIHLEPVSLGNDFNQQPNIIRSGINAAKQLMNMAKPNEILVSPSYYENIPPSDQCLTTLFQEVCIKHEKHVIEYQTYLAEIEIEKASKNEPIILGQPLTTKLSLQASDKSGVLDLNSWKYGFASLFIVVTVFLVVEFAISPAIINDKNIKNLPFKASQALNVKLPSARPIVSLPNDKVINKDNTTVEGSAEPVSLVKTTQADKNNKKTKKKADSATSNVQSKQIINWESFKNSIKQGQKKGCTQSEIALNQCR
ncbi:MAG: hypothetical protein V4545_04290 [Pseudomonadota bacterium]